ncbi:unnamed protein product [Trichobilharzia szidati]|nr:unnamed protein product [Trichobilharzia szidati]
MSLVPCRGGGRLQTFVLTRDINSLVNSLNNGFYVNTVNRYSETALFIASYYGDIDMVDLLLSRDADPNLQTTEGNTPLHSAACNGHTEVMQKLIAAGADENLKNSQGLTASDLLNLNHSEEKSETSKCDSKKRSEIRKTNRDSLRKHQIKLSKTESKCLTSFCSFTFDHSHRPREFISSIPIRKKSEIEGDLCESSHYSHKEDFILRDRKRWHGSIPVLTHQLNPIIVQFLGGSLNSKIKDILHNLLIRELEVCRRIHHPNIMSLLAIIYDDAIQTESRDQLINPSSLVLMYELPSLGNLHEYIQVKHNKFSTLSVLIISYQISEALVFLHSSGIVHCGITPYAVHLYAVDKAKLGNFEYAQYIENYENTSTEDHYYSDDSIVNKSKLNSTSRVPHLSSVFNLILGVYYLPSNCLTDWLPPELYDSTKALFKFPNFLMALQTISIDELKQTIKPCTASDVFSFGRVIQFILMKSQEKHEIFTECYSNPGNLSTLVSSAIKLNPDERLQMTQFNRLLIHLFWIEYDQEKSPKPALFNSMPPCPLRLCDHKYRPRYFDPVPLVYAKNSTGSNSRLRTISPIDYHQKLSVSSTESKEQSKKPALKLFRRSEPLNSSTHRSFLNSEKAKHLQKSENNTSDASVQRINTSRGDRSDSLISAMAATTANREKSAFQPVDMISTQTDRQQSTKKDRKRSWHKMFMYTKRLTSTKHNSPYKVNSKGTCQKSKSINKRKKRETETDSQSVKPISTTNTDSERTNPKQHTSSLTDWFTRRRLKSPNGSTSPDINNIKFKSYMDSTPVAKAESTHIINTSSNYTVNNSSENNSSRKSHSFFRHFRLSKSDYVHLAAVPLLPEGVEVNPDLISRRDTSSLRQSLVKSPRNPLISPLSEPNSFVTQGRDVRDNSGDILCEKAANYQLNSSRCKSVSSKPETPTPVKPASHITQVLSMSVENPDASGRIDLIRTSSLLTRKQRYLKRLKAAQELDSPLINNNNPLYTKHPYLQSFRTTPTLTPNVSGNRFRRVHSFPALSRQSDTTIKSKSGNHDASVQINYEVNETSLKTDDDRSDPDNCYSQRINLALGPTSTHRRLNEVQKKSSIKYTEEPLYSVQSIVQKYEASDEPQKENSSQILNETISLSEFLSKYCKVTTSKSTEANNSPISQNSEKNSHQITANSLNQHEKTQYESNCDSSVSICKVSIGVQCTIASGDNDEDDDDDDGGCRTKHSTCDTSMQTESINCSSCLSSRVVDTCPNSKNNLSLSTHGDNTLNSQIHELAISSSDDFYDLPNPASTGSLSGEIPSKVLTNQITHKSISTSMLDIKCSGQFRKLLNYSKICRSASFHFSQIKSADNVNQSKDFQAFPNKTPTNQPFHDNENEDDTVSSYGSFPTPPATVLQHFNEESDKMPSGDDDDDYHSFLNIPLRSTFQLVGQVNLHPASSSLRNPSSDYLCERNPLSDIQLNSSNCQYLYQSENQYEMNKQLSNYLNSLDTTDENLPPTPE